MVHIFAVREIKKKIKANTKEKVEDKVVSFLKEKESDPTVREIFSCWISEKLSRNEISRATYDRYCIDFDMTAKCFSNFRTLVYGIFKYAKRKKYVSFSITYTIQDMEISRRAFKKVVNRASDQVFYLKRKTI